jgi:3-methylcrotonyl-CoA carboxylase alpha subunit
VLLHEEHAALAHARAGSDPYSPWAIADGWRIGHAGKRIVVLAQGGERHDVEARGYGGDYALNCDDARCTVRQARIEGDWLNARFDGEARRIRVAVDIHRVRVHLDEAARETFTRAPAFAFEAATREGGDRVIAPMPGRVVLVKAKAGDEVEKDQELLVMEAMKMELTLRAPRAGKLESVHAAAGDFVEADAVLIAFAHERGSPGTIIREKM